MKDCDNNELVIGDRVAVQSTYYKTLSIQYVIGFTPKMVKVSSERNQTDPRWYYRNVEPARIVKVFNQPTQED